MKISRTSSSKKWFPYEPYEFSWMCLNVSLDWTFPHGGFHPTTRPPRWPWDSLTIRLHKGNVRPSASRGVRNRGWLGSFGCFKKIGVPQNGWFIMENPIKTGWFGGTPIFGNIHLENESHGIMTWWVFVFSSEIWRWKPNHGGKKTLNFRKGMGAWWIFFTNQKKPRSTKNKQMQKKHKCIQIRIQNQTNPKRTEVSVSMIQYTYPKEKTIVLAPSEYLIISHTILLFALLHKGRVFWPSFSQDKNFGAILDAQLEFCHCSL